MHVAARSDLRALSALAVGVLSRFLPFATPHFTPSDRLPGRVFALASRHYCEIIITALIP